MILVDANLLVYAHVATFPQHTCGSREWLDERISGTAPVGHALAEPPRSDLSATPDFDRPSSVMTVAPGGPGRGVDRTPLPTERHREVLAPLMRSAEGRANLVPDAHIAALAIEHGLVLCSTDGDFARFEGLEWRNPLG